MTVDVFRASMYCKTASLRWALLHKSPRLTGAPEFETKHRNPLICIAPAFRLPLQQAQLGVVRGLLDLQSGQHIGVALGDGGHALDGRSVVDADADAVVLDAPQVRC